MFKFIRSVLICTLFIALSVSAEAAKKKTNEVASCETDADCPFSGYYVCNCDYKCEHKGIFPMYLSEFIGLVVLPPLLAFANVGGVGGGGLIIPITMALF
jgi:hypothetical protein